MFRSLLTSFFFLLYGFIFYLVSYHYPTSYHDHFFIFCITSHYFILSSPIFSITTFIFYYLFFSPVYLPSFFLSLITHFRLPSTPLHLSITSFRLPSLIFVSHR